MGLLDGGIQALGGTIFGAFYLNGQLWRSTKDASGRPIVPLTWTPHTMKVQQDDYSVSQRAAANIPEKSVRLIILQKSLDIEPLNDDEATVPAHAGLPARRYRLSSRSRDPAGIGWVFTGTPSTEAP